MEFRQLQHFLVVAQELNFSKAAQKSYITQQALSKSIKILYLSVFPGDSP